MKKKYRIPLLIATIIIVVLLGIFLMNLFKKDEHNVNIKVVDSIDNFGYTLDERDTLLMKDTYNELKEELNKTTLDYEIYASILAKLFVIDLFSLDNKVNKYDIGSTEYVYPDALENFKLNVENTLYKSIENNSNNKRKQSLPTVKEVKVNETKTGEYKINEENLESFIVNITWDYETDLGYDTSAIITLVNKDNKLYVVEYSVGDNND